MKFTYFDIHGHVNFPEYDADREEVIARAQAAGVGLVTVGTDLESSGQAIKLAETHENMWAIVGVHPVHTAESHHGPAAAFDHEAFKKLAVHPKVIAIGECGLDYFHSKPEEIAHQREVFLQHIQLANETKKPLMLHVRNAKADPKNPGQVGPSAYQDAVALLKEHAKVPVNFHFFAGTIDDAKAILDIGGTMSFTGVLTFARNYDEVVKYIPLECMMSETDCPYVAPIPYRGQRSEPVHTIEVVKAIAKIRGDDEEEVRVQIRENVRRVFGI